MGRGASDTDTPTPRRQAEVDLEGGAVNVALEDGTLARVLGYVLRDSEGKMRIVARSSEDIEIDEIRTLVADGDTGSA